MPKATVATVEQKIDLHVDACSERYDAIDKRLYRIEFILIGASASMLGMSGMSAPRKTLDDFDFGPFSYGPNETRHPGFTGYDITQMMIGQDPEFMSRIYYGQQADRLAGGGVENTLAAMQYLKERNEAREAERFAKYGNPAPGSKFANPNLGNQEPTYATRQDYDQPQITDIDIFGTLL